jgi:hypothetical protein
LELTAFLGGLVCFLFVLLKILFMPISKHSFILKAIKRLYFIRTKNPEKFGIKSFKKIKKYNEYE